MDDENDGDDDYFDNESEKRAVANHLKKIADETAAFLAKLDQKNFAHLYQRVQEATKADSSFMQQFINSIIESTSDGANIKARRRLMELADYLDYNDDAEEDY